MSQRSKVVALVGAQYGSEGKGAIAALVAKDFDVHVRVGGPNAGHTVYRGDTPYVMQSIPCGWLNPHAHLVIGAGAVVDLQQLEKELTMLREVEPDIGRRVFIDSHASVLGEHERRAEGFVDGELHQRIGSTGKGVGACRLGRIGRDPLNHVLVGESGEVGALESIFGITVCDTVDLLTACRADRRSILLEGTQGSGLSLVHGPWPYVTSADTNAAQLASDAGIPPHAVTGCILVARTFPIRVAGNSGPMHHETDWEAMSEKLGREVTERTTVTKKTRRVGLWDRDLFSRAVALNGPTEVALTFADYLNDGRDAGKTAWSDLTVTKDFVRWVEDTHHVYIRWITTGPLPCHAIDRGAR